MIPRRWFPKWHRPAPGQLMFRFLLVWMPLELRRPPEPAQRARPTLRWNGPSWRPRRLRSESRPSEDRLERTIDRLVRRRAACVLCGFWPAPCDHRIRGRLMLVCRACQARPETRTRLDEIVRVDWAATPDPLEVSTSGGPESVVMRPNTY
jgi:hypothetical protein